MKKLLTLILAFCIVFALTACSNSNAPMDEELFSDTDVISEDFKIPLGDTGAKVSIPAEMGFEAYETKLNDFYGGGPNGEWRIIVNTDLKSDYAEYTLEEYSALNAKANNGEAAQDADGNHYFVYINKVSTEEIYQFYTAVREGEENYYRVAFYCFRDLWDNYSEKFAQWATTIEVE